ncbi:hypothetical protein GCM10007916_23150 [Psychromonas marina]|uniref:Pesticidal crystal protein Cry22Aa Ig-like domain-containing protein n=1 Tax=Psychromonas marina TaxID=88364 RepID=A0ABQ6E2N7_9GAMM|nr:immunoglobulin-like domain-containing protein [Psychromonas marina]GLS91246.1 hypothetical protein GCM10007916_23150 [Psychromonas marina]
MTFNKKLLSVLIAATLSGCGGSSESPEIPTTTTLSGKVADGYLSGANVCLDVNENKVCDVDEPSATSMAGGVFNIEDISQSDIDTYPLVVEIIKNVTVDEDNPGVAVSKSYSLSAPAGFTFISPLTTMIQNEIEKGIAAIQAEINVQQQLGTSTALNDDYIDGQNDDENKQEFEKLHQVAQVAARIIANNIERYDGNLFHNDISLAQLNTFINNELLASIAEISLQIDTAIEEGDSFEPDAIASEIDEQFIDVEAHTGILADRTPPVITLIGEEIVSLIQGNEYEEKGSITTDNVDTGLVATISGYVDIDRLGTYYLTYSVKDAADNLATAVRTVEVVAEDPVDLPPQEEFYLFHSDYDDSAYVQYWGDVWTSGTVYSEYTGESTYSKVLEIPSGTNWGNIGAIAWGNEAANAIDILSYTHAKFKVKTDTFSTVSIVVISPNAPDYEVGYLINEGHVLDEGWVEIEALLPEFSEMTWFGLKFDGDTQGSALLADVHFVTQEVVVSGPAEAAPIPQVSDQEAIVLYSDSLIQDKYISVWNSNWWNAPIYSQGDIEGNHYAKYEITATGTNGGAVGLEFGIENGVVDASEKTMMNFDMYVEEGITQIQLKLVSDGGDSLYKTIDPPTGEWVSHEAVFADLVLLSGTLDPSTLKLAGFIVFGEAGRSFYVDNIYFSGESIFSDLAITVTDENDTPIAGATVSVGSTSVITDSHGVAVLNLQQGEHSIDISVDGLALANETLSNVGGDASLTVVMEALYPMPAVAAPIPDIANEDAFVLYSDTLIVDKNISYWEDNWWNAPLFSAVKIVDNNTAKFQITPAGQAGGVTGIQYGIVGGAIDVSDKTGLRFDMYATDEITQAVFQLVPADGIHKGIYTMLPVTTGEWVTVDIAFSDLVKPSGELNAAQLTQMGLQLWGTTKDSVYLDNIYFY